MIVLGTLSPDTALSQLIEDAAEAEAAVAAEARRAGERGWVTDLGPAVFATYSQTAINAANVIENATSLIARNRELVPVLLGQIHRVLDAQRNEVASIHQRVEAYAAKVDDPRLKSAAQRMAAVSSRIVATWGQMVANAERIVASSADPETINSIGLSSAHDHWRALAGRIAELQSPGK